MQDRFKLRAWDNQERYYIPDEETNFCHGMMEYWLDKEDCPLVFEQCTGMKDKNGKLIYEGDIVEVPVLYNGIPTGKKQRCKVYYKHGAFNIYAVKSEYLKVIGNIHENPELLEEE
ncbi:YopX family protein [Ligilactobacillus sp. 110_WCHN]|uniref:YopX family protein n=1 Tax=Ligilactobacillus sp. 110_WCHN TaxID=3057125 RepID=UPI002673CCCB|nr:YopX family protein [Ligilactobacillus sp. 110_WCHN]MDO3393263.1 YopX family protein [Ligilactobacillus sp. 110_WCHN]